MCFNPQVSLHSQLCLSIQPRHRGWVIIWWTAGWQPPRQPFRSSQLLWPLSSTAGTEMFSSPVTCRKIDYKLTPADLFVWILIMKALFSAILRYKYIVLYVSLRWQVQVVSLACPRGDYLCVAMGRGWMWCLGNTGLLSASILKVGKNGTFLTINTFLYCK